MNDTEFDHALIAAAFRLAGRDGWASVSVAAASREGGLALERARGRFAGRDAILWRFGVLADQAALAGVATEGSERERLFDVLMRRFDVLQTHRDGVRALLRALPGEPAVSLCLAAATLHSMAWMLEGAGIPSTGMRGLLRAKGLTAVWFYSLRAWEKDDSADLSGTMAALDRALARAEEFGKWLDGAAAPGPKPFPEDPPASATPAAA